MKLDVNTILIDMDVMIPEQVVENPDGSYSIFLNSRLTHERHIESYAHAMRHIKNGDFEGNNAYFVYYEIKEAVRKEMIKLIGIYGSANKAWIPEIKQLPRIKEV